MYRLAKKVNQKQTEQKMSMDEPWNDCLNLIEHVSDAYIERVMLQQFISSTHYLAPSTSPLTVSVLNKLKIGRAHV